MLYEELLEAPVYNIFLVMSLKRCKDEDAVERVFLQYNKKDCKTKIKYLDICRGNPKTFFAPATEGGLEAEYLTKRSMLLTGSWR
jgi:hypothetical protein